MSLLNTKKLTARSFLHLQDPPDARLELVNGEIAVSPSPTLEHSFIDRMLTTILNTHILQHHLGRLYGDIDTLFDEFNVRRPDLLFIRTERLALLMNATVCAIPPDLCIEILSPSSSTMDQVEKFELYQKHGVPHYWLVDPKAQSIDAYTLTNGTYQLAATAKGSAIAHLPPFPELAINLGDLWPT